MNTWTPDTIKELRKGLKMTQEAFAQAIGVTPTYVNNLERSVKTPGKTLCILFDCMDKRLKKRRKYDTRIVQTR